MTQYPQWYVWINGVRRAIRVRVTDGTLNRMALFENGDLITRQVGSNFDGQGISLGTLQFAGMVQGSLQDLINAFFTQFPDAARRELNAEGFPLYEEILAVLPDKLPHLFNRINKYPAIVPDDVHPQQYGPYLMAARRGDADIIEPWKSGLVRMAMCPEWQQAELPFIQGYIDAAAALTMYYENNSGGDSIATDRCFDICFDIMCQSGGTTKYPLGETEYRSKLYAIIYGYTLHMGDSEWARQAVARKMALLNGQYDMYNWTASYDDETMWEVEELANVPMNTGDLPDSVQPPPVGDIWPVQPPSCPPAVAINYLIERGVMPRDALQRADRPITWGEVATVLHNNNKYLWETHLKYIQKG